MVPAGCVFVAGIHPSRTWSGSAESVGWNEYVHRLDLGLYSHPKEFWGNGVRTHVNSKRKFPLPEKFSPEENRTHDPASSRTARPTQPTSYSGPSFSSLTTLPWSCSWTEPMLSLIKFITLPSTSVLIRPVVTSSLARSPRWPSGSGVRLESGRSGVGIPRAPGFFSRSSHTSDLKTGTPVATLPDAWCYRVSAVTGWPVSVYCDWVRWKFWSATYLSVTARKIVWADPSLRYTCLSLGC